MDDGTDAAMIGLWGVVIGALLSLVGTVIVPWIRESAERKRAERERLATERRDLLLAAMTALLEMRQRPAGDLLRGEAQAKFGARLNELTVRLTPNEQPILDVLILMLSMVQGRTRDVADRVGEAMLVLTLWARGDISTAEVIPSVERQAGVVFSEDHKTASRVPAEEHS
ncbi:hypothetical protein [Microbacterium aurantiacum]|uniref:hypothetical protein n=1 Tax=Microbacterium aurantiacum TaxID=162393 RepID=UPI000C80B464|nr:hypothetical protein [Microbacterium aurantiacum]